MTHFIRFGRETIADCDTSADDLHVVVLVKPLWTLLLSRPPETHSSLIEDFGRLQELRGEYHEGIRDPATPSRFTENRFRELCKKHDLQYCVD